MEFPALIDWANPFRILEIMFMKHCGPNYLLVHKDGALLAMLLIIVSHLTKFEVPSYL